MSSRYGFVVVFVFQVVVLSMLRVWAFICRVLICRVIFCLLLFLFELRQVSFFRLPIPLLQLTTLLLDVLNPGAAGFFNNVKVWIVRENSAMIHYCSGSNDAVAHGNISVLTFKKPCAPRNFPI